MQKLLLCDIGNTSYHFFDGDAEFKKDVVDFDPSKIKERVYFISVNQKITKKLSMLGNWIDLESFINKQNYYESMGIDRVVACESIEHGVVLDAGSAITVDIIQYKKFIGGFIYPGVKAMRESFAKISPILDISFNFDLELDIMPKNSKDAISYGFLKTLYLEVVSHNLPIILTGGDANKFKKIFPDATVDERLIFKGMLKIMKKADLC